MWHPMSAIYPSECAHLYLPSRPAIHGCLDFLCMLSVAIPRHAVGLIGVGEEEDEGRRLFMVQDFLPGGSLKRVVAEQSLNWHVSCR